jgi:hypothetical protein
MVRVRKEIGHRRPIKPGQLAHGFRVPPRMLALEMEVFSPLQSLFKVCWRQAGVSQQVGIYAVVLWRVLHGRNIARISPSLARPKLDGSVRVVRGVAWRGNLRKGACVTATVALRRYKEPEKGGKNGQ